MQVQTSQLQTIFCFLGFRTFFQISYPFFQNSTNQHIFSEHQPLFSDPSFDFWPILRYVHPLRQVGSIPKSSTPPPEIGFFMPGRAPGWVPDRPATTATIFRTHNNNFQNPYQQFSELLATIFRTHINNFQNSYQQFSEVLSTIFRSLINNFQNSYQQISDHVSPALMPSV